MNDTTRPCPYCAGPIRSCARLIPGRPLDYPIPCYLECVVCGYQEETLPLTRQDLRKLIQDGFKRRKKRNEPS